MRRTPKDISAFTCAGHNLSAPVLFDFLHACLPNSRGTFFCVFVSFPNAHGPSYGGVWGKHKQNLKPIQKQLPKSVQLQTSEPQDIKTQPKINHYTRWIFKRGPTNLHRATQPPQPNPRWIPPGPWIPAPCCRPNLPNNSGAHPRWLPATRLDRGARTAVVWRRM